MMVNVGASSMLITLVNILGSLYSIGVNVTIAFLISNILPSYNRSELDGQGDHVNGGNKFKKQFK